MSTRPSTYGTLSTYSTATTTSTSYPSSQNQNQNQNQSQSQSQNQNRNRQYAHLGAQLAQLNAQLADLENLLRMTAVQAEYVRGLGGWAGGLFMASSKILGEEAAEGVGVGNGNGNGAEGVRDGEVGEE